MTVRLFVLQCGFFFGAIFSYFHDSISKLSETHTQLGDDVLFINMLGIGRQDRRFTVDGANRSCVSDPQHPSRKSWPFPLTVLDEVAVGAQYL
jgi:hypothetical protein